MTQCPVPGCSDYAPREEGAQDVQEFDQPQKQKGRSQDIKECQHGL